MLEACMIFELMILKRRSLCLRKQKVTLHIGGTNVHSFEGITPAAKAK